MRPRLKGKGLNNMQPTSMMRIKEEQWRSRKAPLRTGTTRRNPQLSTMCMCKCTLRRNPLVPHP